METNIYKYDDIFLNRVLDWVIESEYIFCQSNTFTYLDAFILKYSIDDDFKNWLIKEGVNSDKEYINRFISYLHPRMSWKA